MESAILEFLGPWAWVVFGLVLLGAEILLPSTFLLWPGIAALIVGLATLILGLNNPVWPWQAQVIIFLILSLIIAYFGRSYVRSKDQSEDMGLSLNERGNQMIGKTANLDQPIVNGSGRVRIGDTTWRVTGPDAEAGETVRITGCDGATLEVELLGTAAN